MTTSHGHLAPGACSVAFEDAGASAYGTAAQAQFFVALEQPGPWGRDAATQSHLPAEVGRALSQACGDRGGRFTLLRRPGRHADDHGQDHRHADGHPAPWGGEDIGRLTAYAAFAGDSPWLLQGRLDDPADLLSLDYEALARGDRDAVAASLPGAAPAPAVLLVCTNGRRDVCCAVRGRPVALDAARQQPGRVWEASHTGGHRFAPTGVLLPIGATVARLDPSLCVDLLTSADRGELPARAIGPLRDRGRSSLDPGAQVAEAHVRDLLAETVVGALSTEPMPVAEQGRHGTEESPTPRQYVVRHRDGRAWQVDCTATSDLLLPESCGKAPVSVTTWSVTASPSG